MKIRHILLATTCTAALALGGCASNPTESAAVGALVSALVGRYVTKEFRFSAMPAILLRSAILSYCVIKYEA